MQHQVSQILTSLIPPSTTKIAVAISGGADSMALVLLLQQWCNQQYPNNHRGEPSPLGRGQGEGCINIHALHVNHRLRHNAGEEAQMVQQWLMPHNINTHILTPTSSIDAMQGNLMQNARQVRYELMQQYCAQHHITLLCVAHHMEDQAETFLMRLGRASGITGLAAMQPQTQTHNLTILRPLLTLHKSQLIRYLQEQNQPWINDPTNHNPKYMRTKMRNLLPILAEAGIATQRISQTTQHLARTADFLQQHTHQWLQNHCINYPITPLPSPPAPLPKGEGSAPSLHLTSVPITSCAASLKKTHLLINEPQTNLRGEPSPSGRGQGEGNNLQQISLPIQPWLALHEEMQLRTLGLCLRKIQPHKPELRYEKLESLRQIMLHPHSFKGRTLHHCCIKAADNCYIISPEPLKN